MTRLSRFISTVALLLVLLGQHGCNDSSMQPCEREVNLLLNGSFERAGEPTLDGWIVFPSAEAIEIVPSPAPGGGKYSLKMTSGGLVAPPKRVTAGVCEAREGEVYRLSAYIRGTGRSGPGGRIGLSVGPDLESNGKKVANYDTVWTLVSLVDTIGADSQDSVRVWLLNLPGGCTQFGAGLFDLVTLERLEE